MFTIEMHVVGSYRANCYVLRSGGEVLVVDPGDEPSRLIDAIGEARVREIVLTHCHCDHIGAVNELVERYGARVSIGREDAAGLADPHLSGFDEEGRDYRVERCDRALAEGETIAWGEDRLRVVETPGHTPGSICLYSPGLLLTGDTLFAGGVGRTDFLRGDAAAMRSSCARLARFPGETVILPGHGSRSSIAAETAGNPWLRGAVAK